MGGIVGSLASAKASSGVYIFGIGTETDVAIVVLGLRTIPLVGEAREDLIEIG